MLTSFRLSCNVAASCCSSAAPERGHRPISHIYFASFSNTRAVSRIVYDAACRAVVHDHRRFTMFSASVRARGVKMMFDLSVGVAVIERTNDGLRFLSMAMLNSLFALWLSSTTTTGFICLTTCMSAVSGVSASSSSRSLKYSENAMRFPFSW